MEIAWNYDDNDRLISEFRNDFSSGKSLGATARLMM